MADPGPLHHGGGCLAAAPACFGAVGRSTAISAPLRQSAASSTLRVASSASYASAASSWASRHPTSSAVARWASVLALVADATRRARAVRRCVCRAHRQSGSALAGLGRPQIWRPCAAPSARHPGAVARRAVTVSNFRALTKIRLRELPDVNSRPTGAVLEAGEIFQVTDNVNPTSPDSPGFFCVAGHNAWVFTTGIAGDWVGKPIIERLEDTKVQKSAAEREQEEEKAIEDAERAFDPQGPADIDLLRLLSWGRGQPALKIHPAVSVGQSRLIVSMPIVKGTPLVGVMVDLTLSDAPTLEDGAHGPEKELQQLIADSAGADSWSLRLGLQLLKEKSDPSSPWRMYLNSLAPRPPAPVMWSANSLAELQYKPARRAIQDQAQRIAGLAKTLEATFLGSPHSDAAAELTWAIAASEERAVEVKGQQFLIPLLDLAGPPEGPGLEAILSTDDVPMPTCEIDADGEGKDMIFVLYATRNLQPGDVLTRDVKLSSDELLLRHGLVACAKEGDRVTLSSCVADGSAKSWQRNAITRALRTNSNRLGDLEFPGELCRSSELTEAISESFFHVARVLTCASEDQLEVYVGEPSSVSAKAGDARGLVGLSGARRIACIDKLTQLIKAGRGEFATTAEEDTSSLKSLKGTGCVAAGFRLEKKRLIQAVLDLLERSKSEPEEASALPFAVTGQKP